MIAIPFTLYDVLSWAAAAISEAVTRPDLGDAEIPWRLAQTISTGMFPPGSEAGDALDVILDAASPFYDGVSGRMLLWNALSATAVAALPAMECDPETTAIALADARAARDMDGLPVPWRNALRVIAGEIELIAVTGTPA